MAEKHLKMAVFFTIIVLIVLSIIFIVQDAGSSDYELVDDGVEYCCSFETDGKARFCVAKAPRDCSVCQGFCRT